MVILPGFTTTPSKNIFKIMRFLNGVERSSYTVRISQKIKVKKREWFSIPVELFGGPTPLKNIFKIMRFLNGVERSSYTVRISQKIKVKKRERGVNYSMDVALTDIYVVSIWMNLCQGNRLPLKNIFKIMRFLNGVERSSYTVRIFQKIKVKKREWFR